MWPAGGAKWAAALSLPMQLLLLTVLLLLLVLWWQRRSWQLIWQLNGWRGVAQQPLLWLLLCVYLDPKSILQTISRLRKHFQRPLAIVVGNRVLLYVDDPVMMERVLNAPACVDKTFMHDGFFARRGLLHAKGQKWKTRRRQLNPAFSESILLSFFDTFNAVGNELQQKFAQELQGDAVKFQDVEDLLSRAVLEVSCLTTMGTATNFTQRDARGIARMYKRLMTISAMRVVKPWLQSDLLLRLLAPQAYVSSRNSNKMAEQFVADIVRRKHDAWQRNKLAYTATTAASARATTTSTAITSGKALNDSANVYNGARDSNTQKRIFIEQVFHLADAGELTLQDIADESNSMVLVSFETVSNSIIIALLCLAAHPECQHSLRQEINDTFAADGVAAVSAAQLKQLKYLDMVVHESLRLLTTIPMNLREVSRDFQLSVPTRGANSKGAATEVLLTLPKQTMLLLDSFNMQRDAAYWGPRAMQFYPPHFGDEQQASTSEPTRQRHLYAFIPFSRGVRTCIGQRYSIFLLKIFLVKLIFAFEFRTATKLEQLSFVEGISLKFNNCERITFEIRKIIERDDATIKSCV